MGDGDPPLREQFLNVAQTQGEPIVQPDSMTDDFRGEPVSVVAASIGFHQPNLPTTGSSWQCPRPCIILSSPNIFLSVAMGLDWEDSSQEDHR